MKSKIMKEIEVIFWGNDLFSIVTLENLIQNKIKIKGIIASPDQPAGRKMKLTPPPIKIWAKKNNISLWQPKKLKEFDWHKIITDQNFIFLIASYGRIIPDEILKLSPFGTLNIHPSLLPKWRGPSPIQTSILTDEVESGVTLMLVDELMDHGPIIIQKKVKIVNKNFLELQKELAELGAKLFIENLNNYLNKKIKPIKQIERLATYSFKIKTTDAELDFNDKDGSIKKIRAYLGNTPLFFFIKEGNKKLRIKINELELKNNKVFIKKVTPAGKKQMTGPEFLNYLINKKIRFDYTNFLEFS